MRNSGIVCRSKDRLSKIYILVYRIDAFRSPMAEFKVNWQNFSIFTVGSFIDLVMKFHFASVYKQVPAEDLESFQSWTWQLQNAFKTRDDFASKFSLTANEYNAFNETIFNIRATPYYTMLASNNEHDPIRKILMPSSLELTNSIGNHLDPLGEKKNNPVPRIIHRYSDRVLFLVTDICSVYCRYCTRKHFTGQEQAFIKPDQMAQALQYIQSHPGIREVILSGGDPLTLGDAQLEKVLSSLRQIEHVEIIRIGSRMPVVCPMRITPSLVAMIRKYKPVFMMTHFNHPKEITSEAAQALELMVDHGIPVMNQAVLLNGINNHPAIIQALSRRLLYLRVKPYYLFQCDPSEGTDHLRTSVDETLAIQKELWGHLSGLAMPHFTLDIPAGGGKVGLTPQFEVEQNASYRIYKGWDGVEASYVNPKATSMLPADVTEYLPEWELLKSARVGLAKNL